MELQQAYRRKAKMDHFLVSILFTVAFFVYMYLFIYLPFTIIVPLLGGFFILWALSEGRGKRTIVERLFPFYRDLLDIERRLAPNTFASYRLSLRSSLWVVGVILILVGILELVGIINAEPDVFPFTAFYPIALIVVNVNVYLRHQRIESGEEDR
ncbi:hypothetical protein [Natribacillus halophilus]|uniref:Uncharacterized protein n=1 Tax=Natribacillus halophilus TaxID=549003 RepID=A0A1G8R289_9BACI|nr:hypothetical protein [Natribacillus halophilus]SDJ11061.1 hypothetical protein SAMN04488123_11519 [Natribacillus halophilus]